MNFKFNKMKNFFTKIVLFATFNVIILNSQAQNSVTVTVYPLPTITLGSNPSVCSGTTTADLTYSATTQTPTTYSINFNAAAETEGFSDVADVALPVSPISITVPAAAAAGTYNATLTVKNANTCVSISYNISVTINTIPGAATIVANSRCGTGPVVMTAGIGANGNQVEFSEDGGTTTDGTDNSSPYEYTTSSITAGSTKTIHVRTVNTVTGCTGAWTNSAVATANTIPTADAGTSPGDITCTDPTRTLSGSGGGSYAWSTADGNITAGAATATPTIDQGGTYSLTVTVSGCASTNSATVVVGESGTIPDVATISANSRCGTGTVIMTAGIGANGNQVEFSEDAGTTTNGTDNSSPYVYTTSSITAGSTKIIHVRTVNTVTGCASAWTNSAVATANVIPTVTISSDGDICNGISTNLNFTLTGTANWTVKYDDGTTVTTINNIASSPHVISVTPGSTTTYTLTEVSDANCTNTNP